MQSDLAKKAQTIALKSESIDPADLEQFIAEACGDNDALLLEVRRLLGSERTIEVQSDSPDQTVVDNSPASRHRSRVPDQIGSFHVRREIGVGGMGAVYEAIQENPRRRVAIKVLKASVASEAARKRFEYESQVLARLKHPGIAEIYEAGTYDDGEEQMPYFAMEYIAGRKQIDAHCTEKQLGNEARLRLFTQVCDALHHGHQKAVVHRDLKPGNILVDTQGHPRVIDFGVARATDSDVALATMQTEVGQIIGTVEYMSPEQCEGDPELVDVRSDIYSLGVILFELLTGRRPHQFEGSTIFEAVRTIREDAPTRMGMVNRGLRGDLETIVGKALEKDPDRRYQSALEFKQDIERFLANEPIEARPPSLVYQTKMFAKRHKGVAASIVVVAMVLVVTTAWSLVERGRASRSAEAALAAEVQAQLAAEKARTAEVQATEDRDAALAAEAATASALARVEAETARTLQAMDFVTGIFQLANPANAQGRELGILEIFREASGQIEETFAEEPAMAAELYATIGGLQLELGDVDGADKNLVKALVLAEREHGTSSLEALNVGVFIAAVMVEQGRYDEAASRLESILVATGAIGEDALAVDLLARKWMLEILGSQLRMAEAMEMSMGLVADAREFYGPDHEKTVMYGVEYTNYLATDLRISGQATPEEFELPYQNIERVRSIMGDLHPVTISARLVEAMLLLPGAFTSRDVASSEKMRELLDGIVADCRLVLGDSHSDTLDAIYIYGLSQLMSGDPDTAVATLGEAYDGYVENHSIEHPMAHQIATMLGGTLLNLGLAEEATPLLKTSWDGMVRLWGEEDIRTLTAQSNYVIALMQLGRFEESRDDFEHALQIHDLFPEPIISRSYLTMLLSKAMALLEHGHVAEAIATSERLIEEAERRTQADTRSRWAFPAEIVKLFLEKDHPELGARFARRTFPLIRELLADNPNESLQLQVGLSRMLLLAGEAQAASEVLEQAIELVGQDGVEEARSARALVLAGLARARTDRAAEGIPLIEEGLSRISGVSAQLASRQALAEAMANAGRIEEAREQALAIMPGFNAIWDEVEEAANWTLEWLLSEEAGLDDSELLGVAEWATVHADPQRTIKCVQIVIGTLPQQRIETVLPVLEAALEEANATLDEPSTPFTYAWFDVTCWRLHFLNEAGDTEAAAELADQVARQQWAVLGDDDSQRQATFVATSGGVLDLLAAALGEEDHRVLANRARVAMARDDNETAAWFFRKAAEATDDSDQKAVYEGLVSDGE